jgi:hypothetical protein
MRLFVIAISLMISAGQAAKAQQSPVTGYFRYFSARNPVTLGEQLACSFGFFKQDKDGKGFDYLLDRPKFAETGQISYRIVSSFDCKYVAASQTEVCVLQPRFTSHEKSTSYFRYGPITENKVEAVVFGSLRDLLAATTDPENNPPPDDPDRVIRCEGWTDEALKPFIDLTPVTAADEHLLDGWIYPFSGTDSAKNRRDAEKIRQVILGQ